MVSILWNSNILRSRVLATLNAAVMLIADGQAKEENYNH